MAQRREPQGAGLDSSEKKEPFAFAGLWDLWRDSEGQILYTFTIITTVPNALLRSIHNRMPVIFDRLSAKQWLEPNFKPIRLPSLLC
jgi:putative SOS response-associated peptidase YedK